MQQQPASQHAKQQKEKRGRQNVTDKEKVHPEYTSRNNSPMRIYKIYRGVCVGGWGRPEESEECSFHLLRSSRPSIVPFPCTSRLCSWVISIFQILLHYNLNCALTSLFFYCARWDSCTYRWQWHVLSIPLLLLLFGEIHFRKIIIITSWMVYNVAAVVATTAAGIVYTFVRFLWFFFSVLRMYNEF